MMSLLDVDRDENKKRKLTEREEDGILEDFSEVSIRKMLELLSREQLIEILVDSGNFHAGLLESIRRLADADPSHRKIFVRGLGVDTTADTLRSVFGQHGEIEELSVINDRHTGKSKGYGFITYQHVDGAFRALVDPSKRIDGRITVCQLAATGTSVASQIGEHSHRKIYVGNVPLDVSPEVLLDYFSKYGDVEEGPIGFDKNTNKSRGYALFLYKTVDAATKALAEPLKKLNGHVIQCKMATTDGKKQLGQLSDSTFASSKDGPPGHSTGGMQNQQQQIPRIAPPPQTTPSYGFFPAPYSSDFVPQSGVHSQYSTHSHEMRQVGGQAGSIEYSPVPCPPASSSHLTPYDPHNGFVNLPASTAGAAQSVYVGSGVGSYGGQKGLLQPEAHYSSLGGSNLGAPIFSHVLLSPARVVASPAVMAGQPAGAGVSPSRGSYGTGMEPHAGILSTPGGKVKQQVSGGPPLTPPHKKGAQHLGGRQMTQGVISQQGLLPSPQQGLIAVQQQQQQQQSFNRPILSQILSNEGLFIPNPHQHMGMQATVTSNHQEQQHQQHPQLQPGQGHGFQSPILDGTMYALPPGSSLMPLGGPRIGQSQTASTPLLSIPAYYSRPN